MANGQVAAAEAGGRAKILTASWALSSRTCDSCNSSASVLFCRVETAFLCLACDAQIHSPGASHARVWICEVCEQAPAAVTCRADAAALCGACDADIHSANPLARRHERVPVVPFHETPSAVRSSSNPILESCEDPIQACGEEEAEAASWLLPDPNPNPKAVEVGSREYCFSYPYADLNYPCLNDSVVPVQTNSKGFQEQQQHHQEQVFVPSSAEKCVVELDFRRSKATYSYSTAADPSLSQSVSSSSMEVGVVPDGNCSAMTATSNPYDSTLKASSVPVSALDREARVLRYREKRKNRKFEKTIRYASRKAYAETRPRIKGRFAKRAEIDGDIDRLYFPAAAALVPDSGYGVVPSF